jgi:hypothetical protein
MKWFSLWMILLVVAAGASQTCWAMQSNREISPKEAKELGIGVRTQPNGQSGTRVWLEFKTAGLLRNFSHVNLEIADGTKTLVDAPLWTTHPTAESVAVSFSTDPVFVPGSVLTIVVVDGTRTRVGYQIKVKDFLAAAALK